MTRSLGLDRIRDKIAFGGRFSAPGTPRTPGSRIVLAYVDIGDSGAHDGGDVADIGHDVPGAADPHLQKLHGVMMSASLQLSPQ